jgi:hypothetical protein
MVRDIRYVPKLATEIALCACQSNNQLIHQRCMDILKLSSKLRRTKEVNDHSDGNQYDDHRDNSSDGTKNSTVDLTSLERSIRQILVFRLQEKSKELESLNKTKRSKTTTSSFQRCQDEADDFEEIDSDDNYSFIRYKDSCIVVQSKKCSREEYSPSTRKSESQEVNNSPTGSWSEYGSGSSSSPYSIGQRHQQEEKDDESVDGSNTVPIKEISFSSGGGVQIYESDDPFDDD